MRAEVEEVVDKLLEQEPDFDKIDFGEEPKRQASAAEAQEWMIEIDDLLSGEGVEYYVGVRPYVSPGGGLFYVVRISVEAGGYNSAVRDVKAAGFSVHTSSLNPFVFVAWRGVLTGVGVEEQEPPSPDHLDTGPPRPAPLSPAGTAITVDYDDLDKVMRICDNIGLEKDWVAVENAGPDESDVWFGSVEDMMKVTSALEDAGIPYSMRSAPAEDAEQDSIMRERRTK